MAGTIKRGKIIRADLANWDGKTATYSRIDATGGTVSGLAIGNEVDVLQVYGSGTNRTRATIVDAINQISTTNVTLVFAPGTWTIDSNLTIPSNFTCRIPAGCVFSISAGITLSINAAILASPGGQIFTGSGSVLFGTSPAGTSRNATAPVYPEWWGALADGTTNSTAAINAAITALSPWGGIVQFTGGVYLTDGITANGGVGLKGIGKEQTILKSRIAGTLVLLNNSVSIANAGGFTVRDMTLDANSLGTTGIQVNNYARFNLQDLKILGFSSRGVYFHGGILAQAVRCQILNCPIGFDGDTDQSTLNAITLRDCSISGSATYGIKLTGASMIVIDACDIEACGTAGNSATGGIWLNTMDTDGLGVAATINGCWLENNNGYAGIRIDAPAASYAAHVINSTHCFGGTRTYGISVPGTGNFVALAVRDSIFQNAGTTDVNIGTNVIGTLDHIRCSTKSITSTDMIILSDPTNSNYQFSGLLRLVNGGGLAIPDGVTAPGTQTGYGTIYIDSADGDLKIKFGDGTVKTIVVDT